MVGVQDKFADEILNVTFASSLVSPAPPHHPTAVTDLETTEHHAAITAIGLSYPSVCHCF